MADKREKIKAILIQHLLLLEMKIRNVFLRKFFVFSLFTTVFFYDKAEEEEEDAAACAFVMYSIQFRL